MDPKGRPVIEMVPRMLGLKTILVPIDFSPASEKALDYAVPFARQFDARITLLHVTQGQFCATEFAYLPIEESECHERLRARLEELALSRIGPEWSGPALVRAGPAFDMIAAVAREIDADLIVINTHGHTGIRHLLMGSTAEMVVRHAPCPVLVVREREHEFV